MQGVQRYWQGKCGDRRRLNGICSTARMAQVHHPKIPKALGQIAPGTAGSAVFAPFVAGEVVEYGCCVFTVST